MRIAQIVSTPPLAWGTGGCSRVVDGLSNALSEYGHDVTVITTDMFEPGTRLQSKLMSKLKYNIVINKNISDSLAWNNKIYLSPSLIFKLFNKNFLKNFDIIHVHDILSIHGIIACYSCKKYDIPYIITTHGSMPWAFKQKVINKIYTKYILKNMLSHSKKIIALNTIEKSLLLKLNIDRNKIEIIPNGVILDNIKSLNKLKISSHKCIGYHGRIHPSKNIELLIDAFKIVHNTAPSTFLIISGHDDGHVVKIYEKIFNLDLNDCVFVITDIDERLKNDLLASLSILVIPNYSGFPISLLESMMVGTPVIVTNAGDKLDIFNERIGLVSENSKEGLAHSILKMLQDEDLLQEYSENAIKVIKNNYSWAAIAPLIMDMYMQAINTKLKK